MSNNVNRRIGLEQEFFIVDAEGVITDRADELLQGCHDLAQTQGRNPENFTPEFIKSMIEINTDPANGVSELADFYLQNLQILLLAAKHLELRLYPLSQYPLHLFPTIRDEPNYHIQARTVGYDRFLDAGRCIGTHLHLELPQGAIDPQVGVSYQVSPEARAEVVNLYNLATAMDAAIIALSRACPFYEGKVFGLAARTVHYRGNQTFGWEGVYTHLPEVGALHPYADSVEQLVEQQFQRYYAWLAALDRTEVERSQFLASGGSLLKSAWNPVRLNGHGTIELRQTDGNYPDVILSIAALVYSAADRVRRESLTVRPSAGVHTFEVQDQQLVVPEFTYLNGELLYAAATEGVKHTGVKTYLDSLLQFVIADQSDGSAYLERLRTTIRTADSEHLYQTTEAKILEQFAPDTDKLTRDDGLALVRAACDRLEAQVESFLHQPESTILEWSSAGE
ncbi:glutamate-cysteine ligase family protein [Nostoc sp.]|uniref:glutamate-cysteine ligase family protein n=1 Tax=Nostoc sp. TaxID=1180 RepID=UPI0035935DEE